MTDQVSHPHTTALPSFICLEIIRQLLTGRLVCYVTSYLNLDQ